MTINDPEAYVASLWNWACLEGCFGNMGIEPTDVDGTVERKGNVLEIETKLPGVPIKTGQDRMFKSKVDEDGYAIFVVWGKPGKPEKIEVRVPGYTKLYEKADLKLLRKICKQWFEYADTHPQAWLGRWEKVRKLARLIADDDATPEEIKRLCQELV